MNRRNFLTAAPALPLLGRIATPAAPAITVPKITFPSAEAISLELAALLPPSLYRA